MTFDTCTPARCSPSASTPKVVSERLGHSSVAFTLDTYAHVMPGMQPASAELFDRLVFGAAENITDTQEEDHPSSVIAP